MKKGEKSDCAKQKSSAAGTNSSKKKLFDRAKSEMDTSMLSDIQPADITDVYHLPDQGYINYPPDMNPINYCSNISTVYAAPACQNNIGIINR